MSEAEIKNEHTILEYLNEDCWRAVLDYVPMYDILRSEQVSQLWQKAMLAYLRGVHIHIRPRGRRFSQSHPAPGPQWPPRDRHGKRYKVGRMKLTDASCSAFESWAWKLGPSVVAAYCNSKDSLNMFGNCPNLEALMFIHLEEDMILRNYNVNFKWLTRICFYECHFTTDRCVRRFMINSALEELEIHGNRKVTGHFLNNKNTKNFKSLILKRCCFIEFTALLSAGNALSGLRRLELERSSFTYEDMHLVLDKMPKLEYVKMLDLARNSNGDKFFEAVCRLRSLKWLCVDMKATDAHVEAVARCCPEIQRLGLSSCRAVTRRGLAAACAHAGARLTTLGIQGCCLTDDDVVNCIRACPNLTTLNLRQCSGLTRKLLPFAASARREMQARRSLRLFVGSLYQGYAIEKKYDGLILLS